MSDRKNVDDENSPLELEGKTGSESESRGALSGLVLDRLAQLDDRAMLNEVALASGLGCADRTLRRMVERGEVPPPISLAGRSVWILGRVFDWLQNRAEREEKEQLTQLARIDAAMA